MYSSVIAATGWRWCDVDELTLPQLRALQSYWAEHPPTHIVVAAIAGGLSGKPVGQAPAMKHTTAEELIAALGTHG